MSNFLNDSGTIENKVGKFG